MRREARDKNLEKLRTIRKGRTLQFLRFPNTHKALTVL